MVHSTCIRVLIREYPSLIEWQYDDGTIETTNHDISTREGQVNLAVRAEELGFGCRRKIAAYLNGFQAVPQNGALLDRMTPIR
jgi:hypothetical protein